MELGHCFAYALLILIKIEALRQMEDFVASTAGVLQFLSQVDVHIFILAEKTACIGLKPSLDIIQHARFHYSCVSKAHSKHSPW
jgi:hypothetical protein